MRYVGIALILLTVPLLISWLNNSPHQRKYAYAMVGLLPFTINAWNLDFALVDWKQWLGYAKGYIITLLDTVCLAIIVTHRTKFLDRPLTIPLCLYIFAAFVSSFFAEVWIVASFYVFQLLRVFLVFYATSIIVSQREGIRWLLIGLACGAIVQAGYAISEALGGRLQASGTLGHQNLLGMMLHSSTLPLIGALLAGLRSKTVIAGIISGIVAVILGVSRGAVGFLAAGIVVLIFLSIFRKPTPLKWKVLGQGLLVIALLAPLAYLKFEDRFSAKPLSDTGYSERKNFADAARAIWSDHPMGVGANEYVAIANSRGYNERAGVTWAWSSRSTNVHNVYLLNAAEMGYLGYFAIIFLFTSAIFYGLRFAFSNRRDPKRDLILGATIAIAATAAQSLYEWVFVTYQAQYVFAIMLGLIAGMRNSAKLD